MSELDEIMEGKHEIKHLDIEGETISFETELDSHTWNLSPRDIEIIIYCLQKELNKYKEVLDKIKEYIEKELLPTHNIKTTDWEYEEVICSDLPVENIKPIVELLEEIK